MIIRDQNIIIGGSPTLPVMGPVVEQSPEPDMILARRIVKKKNAAQTQLLVKWKNQSQDDATWEDYESIAQKFPSLICEDTNFLKEGGVQ